MRAGRQTTLRDQASVAGIGVHSGLPVTLTIHPANAGTGLRFLRGGLDKNSACDIPAHVRAVTATDFATVLGDSSGAQVGTTEHVLAALRGLGVDNAIIEIDGAEVPIMDGSAAAFVDAIDQVGVETLDAPRRFIQVLKPISITSGEAMGELRPYARGLRIEAEIAFDHPAIGRQTYAFDVTPEAFRNDVARARTFGFMRDVTRLWNAGYALGASIDNTVVVTDQRVLNPEGLRFPDEFVRHKALDAVGDLALAGAPLLGCYRTVRGGHRLNHAVLSALLADTSAWTFVEADAVRRPRGHADVTTIGLVAPAYGPDVS